MAILLWNQCLQKYSTLITEVYQFLHNFDNMWKRNLGILVIILILRLTYHSLKDRNGVSILAPTQRFSLSLDIQCKLAHKVYSASAYIYSIQVQLVVCSLNSCWKKGRKQLIMMPRLWSACEVVSEMTQKWPHGLYWRENVLNQVHWRLRILHKDSKFSM